MYLEVGRQTGKLLWFSRLKEKERKKARTWVKILLTGSAFRAVGRKESAHLGEDAFNCFSVPYGRIVLLFKFKFRLTTNICIN